MTGVSVKWKGVDAFVSGVSKQPARVKKEVGGAIYESALRIAKQAQNNAPVDTGFMKQNIQASHPSLLLVRIDSFAGYSWYVEHGTRKMKAQPFLYPAFENEIPRLTAILKSIVENGVM